MVSFAVLLKKQRCLRQFPCDMHLMRTRCYNYFFAKIKVPCNCLQICAVCLLLTSIHLQNLKLTDASRILNKRDCSNVNGKILVQISFHTSASHPVVSILLLKQNRIQNIILTLTQFIKVKCHLFGNNTLRISSFSQQYFFSQRAFALSNLVRTA